MKNLFYLYKAYPGANYVMFPITGNTPKDITDHLLRGRGKPQQMGEYIGPFEATPLPTFKNALRWKLQKFRERQAIRKQKQELNRRMRKWSK